MKIELTIKVNYLPGWGVNEGIRELIQNAKDAETEFNAPMSVRVRTTSADSVGTLVIENEGCTMPYEALLLGHTSKVARGDLIGKFGEGLKLGILALLRAGHAVKIRNGSEVWVPEITHSEKFNAKVLTFDIQSGRKDENRVQIEISGITPEQFRDDIRPRFLWLDKDARRKDDTVETSYGTLLLADRYKGKLYVKGIFVESKPDLSVGYDFSDCEVDRDRRMVDTYDFRYHTRYIWANALKSRPDIFGAFSAMLEASSPEVQSLDSYSASTLPDTFRDHVVEDFVSKFGKMAVPVSNLAESVDLEHFGRVGIVTNAPMRAVLESKMGTLADVQEELKTEVVKTYSWHELTDVQKSNLQRSIDRISVSVPVSLETVSVCDFRSPELMGLYSEDKGIRLASKVVASPVMCLRTLIHEVAHREGRDGDKSHVEQIERIWSEVFTAEVGIY